MAQALKQAIVSKFRDAVPAHKLHNVLFELKSGSGSGGQPELHLNNAPFREHLDAASWQSLLSDRDQWPTASFTKTAAVFPLDKDRLFDEALVASTSASHPLPRPQTILVEFSSPNIAKPFHVGHLRSTIIGNFAANILRRSAHQHRVHRINYLGDWGTQFGYLALGMRMAEADSTTAASSTTTDVRMRTQPIRQLFEAYVRAHQAAKTDPTVADRARQLFCQLEQSDDAASAAATVQWSAYREHTVHELRSTYGRLGVAFDEYCWESDYRKTRIAPLLQQMREHGAMVPHTECAFVAVVDGGRRVPLIKSDGSTMYLARDCAALADRAQRHRFDRMLYVVDNGQADHFRTLLAVGAQMGWPGVRGAEHVKFGRIRGMSTREGSVVFLGDILDEARDRMWAKQMQTHTTRVDVSADAGSDRQTADILGMSAVIVNDLKQRRQRDYTFDWDKALQMSGDTGVKLQYTHCRLCSLLEANVDGDGVRQPCLPLLREPEAEQLLFEMARYADVLARSEEQLEACVLVVYLFGLSNAISRALTKLRVKEHPDEAVRAQRLLLFGRAREILHDGMCILGLRPLERM